MFTGGRLRLKGDAGGINKKKKKKKKTTAKEGAESAGAEHQEKAATAGTGGEAAAAAAAGGGARGTSSSREEKPVDRRTDAERRHDEAVAAREAERVARLASQSHRDRVAAFNAHLATLSEHHDIPKVGPG